MRYFRTVWHHNFPEEPFEIFDTVSIDGRVLARCESFSDGRITWGETQENRNGDSFIEGDFFQHLKRFQDQAQQSCSSKEQLFVEEVDQKRFDLAFINAKSSGYRILSLGALDD